MQGEPSIAIVYEEELQDELECSNEVGVGAVPVGLVQGQHDFLDVLKGGMMNSSGSGLGISGNNIEESCGEVSGVVLKKPVIQSLLTPKGENEHFDKCQ